MPTRRVELPPVGLRDRYTASCATWAWLRAGDGSRTRGGQSGALACHLDSPAWRCCGGSTCYANHRGQRRLRPVTLRVDRVGFEPTFCLGKNQVQSCFATDPWLPVIAMKRASGPGGRSHPLESNQNLSGFSRARRPTTQEWDTSAARPRPTAMSRRVASQRASRRPRPFARRRSSSSFFGCQRAGRRAVGRSLGSGRTSGVGASGLGPGAPRAFMRSR